jgi:tetratricopeptide (TPR) repeat protein
MIRLHSSIFMILCLSLFPSCKKDEAKILKDEISSASSADINVSIKKLNEKIASAKDDFDRSEIYSNVSALELEKGDIASSEKSANAAVKFYPKSALAHYVLGKTHSIAGRYDLAETELITASEIDQKHAPTWFELGNLAYIKNQFNQSVTMYAKAVSLDANYYEAYNNMGSAYYELKKGKESEEAFKKVLSIKSDFAPLYKNMGLLYERLLKDKQKAKASYQEYLKRRPDAPERAAVKFWINDLGK